MIRKPLDTSSPSAVAALESRWILSVLRRKAPFSADYLNRLGAALRINLSHDPAQVVFYGKFRKIQAASNLLVGQPSCNKRHQLALPRGESKLGSSLLISEQRLLTQLPRHELKQSHAQFGRTDHMALGNFTNGSYNFCGGCLLEQIAANPQADSVKERRGILVHSEQYDFDFRRTRNQIFHQACRTIRVQRIQKNHLTLRRQDMLGIRF